VIPPMDISAAAALIKEGELSSVVLVSSTLERLHAVDRHLHAFVTVDAEGALTQAERLDRELQDGRQRGPLHGIPVGIKDIFDVAGMPTKCGCRAFSDVPPASTDSTATARLRQAGAVIVGKTTTHELALGVSTPPTRNPWDLRRSAGGSSGGSGAAVAAGSIMAALGSDTGGSIRTPSALCGVVGLKPTYGRVSRAGVLPLSWSLDHAGAITRSVADAGLLLEILAGPDASDQSTLGQPEFNRPVLSNESLSDRRLGVVPEAFLDPLEESVRNGFEEAVETARTLGAAIVKVSIPELKWALGAEFTIILAEAASYHEELLRMNPELLSEDILTQLQAGYLLPAATYLRAQRTRAVIQAAFRKAFDGHCLDGVLTPTVPCTAHLTEQTEQDMLDLSGTEEPAGQAYVRTTGPANLAGLPAIALPFKLSPEGLPISVQLLARPFQERELLRMAKALHDAAPCGLPWREPAGLGRALETR
jgi:aspartyl-tRNA(Asn)/glutamyl-tRNA(Gln) amidotransferase subunit A